MVSRVRRRPSERRVVISDLAPATPDLKQNVQTLRGLACLLVVSFHVSGIDDIHGIHLDADNTFRLGNEIFSWIRMPLFTFISGYVYAMRPVTAGHEALFFLGKLRRLYLPLVVVGGIYILAQDATPYLTHHTPLNAVWHYLIFPYRHLWFLQALLLIFIFVALCERLRVLSGARGWMVVLVLSIVAHYFVVVADDLFSVSRAVTLLPFFLLGLGMRRFSEVFDRTAIGVPAMVIAGVGLLVHGLMLSGSLNVPTSGEYLLAVATGIGGCIGLMWMDFEFAPLAMIGWFSYAIYLFHVFGTAGARHLLAAAGIDNTAVQILCAFTAGILFPIVVELLIRDRPLLRLFLLGRNPSRHESKIGSHEILVKDA